MPAVSNSPHSYLCVCVCAPVAPPVLVIKIMAANACCVALLLLLHYPLGLGHGVGRLIRRLRARAPQGVLASSHDELKRRLFIGQVGVIG